MENIRNRHLAGFKGKLQVDAYAGFEPLFVATKPDVAASVVEIACWAHVRRKWFDLYEAHASPLAQRGAWSASANCMASRRLSAVNRPKSVGRQRQQYAVPLLAALHAWMIEQSVKVEKGSTFAAAFNYTFNNWDRVAALYRRRSSRDRQQYRRTIACVAVGVGRKNYLFFGSDGGGERAAIIYSLIETCKLNHIDPQRYLHYVLERIADHPINRIEELLPWNLADQLQQPAQVTHALAA